MLGTKNPLFVDRRIYAHRGLWKNPRNDVLVNIYYFISTPMTLASSWDNGREEIKPTVGITIFGEHAFCKHDIIILEDGAEFEVNEITNNYFESNVLVRDLLKPRIESQEITLE